VISAQIGAELSEPRQLLCTMFHMSFFRLLRYSVHYTCMPTEDKIAMSKPYTYRSDHE
jgi:hypothetical protein